MANGRRKIERESRSPSTIEVLINGEAGKAIAATITNVSRRGCHIRCSGSFAVGELLRVMIPRLGAVSAYVRWAGRDEYGAEFAAGTDSWELPAEKSCHPGAPPAIAA